MEPVLLTYGGGNGWWKDSAGCAARPVFNAGEAASGGTLAPRIAIAAVEVGLPPPSIELALLCTKIDRSQG
jgi:hypothetical protein